MIDSIGSMGAMPPPPKGGKSESLTVQQNNILTETLSSFDAESLTSDDAFSIVTALQEAGISHGAGLESAMADLGFDAKSIGDLAGVSGKENSGIAKEQSSTGVHIEMTSMMDFLTETVQEKLAQTGNDDLTTDEKAEVFQQLVEKFGLTEDDKLVDLQA